MVHVPETTHILLLIKIFDNCKIVVTHAQADC